MTTRRIAIYSTCVVVCVSIGAASALVGGPADEWFATLRKPAWTPPAIAFPIVWTMLYITMGLALGGVIEKGGVGGRRAVIAFAVQLILNAAWCPIFFGVHAIGVALLVLVAIWLAVGWAAASCWSVRDWTGALLLPYWAWTTLALALNAAIWRMN